MTLVKMRNKKTRDQHKSKFESSFKFREESIDSAEDEVVLIPSPSKNEHSIELELIKDFMENASIHEDLSDPWHSSDDSDGSSALEESFNPEGLDLYLREHRNNKDNRLEDFGDHPNKERGFRARLKKMEHKSKAKKTKKKEISGNDIRVNLREINRNIKAFINDADLQTIPLQPMQKGDRKIIHLLCRQYNIKSKSAGSGNRRYIVLYKTGQTRIPSDFSQIDKLVNISKDSGNLSSQSSFSKVKMPSTSNKPYKEESLVAEKANPIAESNIGNQLLRKLGWSPGKGLGSNQDGIINPIDAVYKSSKKGLGH